MLQGPGVSRALLQAAVDLTPDLISFQAALQRRLLQAGPYIGLLQHSTCY
jgi:hypothetical protein